MADPELVEQFRVDVPDDVLDDLRDRLARTRWPDQLSGTTWRHGTDTAYLRELCDHWRTGFDWRTQEAAVNAWPQVVTTIDGQRIHAIHARSPHPDATPLLLVHGWPGSVLEFLQVLGPLTDPVAHGGDAADAFHVVCPSLPGFGWSGPTSEPGWDIGRAAAALAELMSRLGYDRFVGQGGDWGAMACARLGALVPDRLLGIHLNMPLGRPQPGDLSETDHQRVDEFAQFRAEEDAYSRLQGTKPQTLAVALTDSPAGLASWIVEKFRTWSDCGGDLESAIDRDWLLANITTYWVTGTAGSSARLYRETGLSKQWGPPRDGVHVPTGVANFAGEPWRIPRSWVEASFDDLRHWTTHERGGHFAALEQPDAFVADVRAFVRTLA